MTVKLIREPPHSVYGLILKIYPPYYTMSTPMPYPTRAQFSLPETKTQSNHVLSRSAPLASIRMFLSKIEFQYNHDVSKFEPYVVVVVV